MRAAIEDFIASHGVDGSSASKLRRLSRPGMRAVLAEGPLDGRNMSAVLVSRINRLPNPELLARNYGTPSPSRSRDGSLDRRRSGSPGSRSASEPPRKQAKTGGGGATGSREVFVPAARAGVKNIMINPYRARSWSTSSSSSSSSGSSRSRSRSRSKRRASSKKRKKANTPKGDNKWDKVPSTDALAASSLGLDNPALAAAVGVGAPVSLGRAAASALEDQKLTLAQGGEGAAGLMAASVLVARQQRQMELYVGNVKPETSFEALQAFFGGVLQALADALPDDAAARDLVNGAIKPICQGRVCPPIGVVDSRTRTDHAFLECKDAKVASTLVRFNGIPAAGIRAGKG